MYAANEGAETVNQPFAFSFYPSVLRLNWRKINEIVTRLPSSGSV